eukprot:GHVU01108488.1.p2 GENE.GHVU01108488.1~~GHVU01108488.1.p2  ORF type:complete len:133 (+),score=21.19 GHVU01108488.1:187-585(+)
MYPLSSVECLKDRPAPASARSASGPSWEAGGAASREWSGEARASELANRPLSSESREDVVTLFRKRVMKRPDPSDDIYDSFQKTADEIDKHFSAAQQVRGKLEEMEALLEGCTVNKSWSAALDYDPTIIDCL